MEITWYFHQSGTYVSLSIRRSTITVAQKIPATHIDKIRHATVYKTFALTDELGAQLKYYGAQNPTPHLQHESSGAAEVAARKFPRIEAPSAIQPNFSCHRHPWDSVALPTHIYC